MEAVDRPRGGPHPDRAPVVFLGKNSLPDPVGPELRTKIALLERHVRPSMVGVGPAGVRRVGGTRIVAFPALRPPAVGGVVFYALGPVAALAMAAGARPSAIVCQSPYGGVGVVALTRFLPRSVRPRVVIEVHGDWRTATRLYGSGARRLMSPIADRLAVWALRRADRVRIIGDFTEGLVRRAGFTGELDRFVAFSEYGAFLDTPLAPPPPEPRVAFVGVLEPYKGVDVLIEAWAGVVGRMPSATLEIVGEGPMLADLRRRVRALGVEGSVTFLGRVTAMEVLELFDRSSCVVLPSRSEGLGRVIIEAFSRSRPVVGTSVGGIVELVEEGRTGFLVPPEDPAALRDRLVEALADPDRLAAMGAEGRRRALARDPSADFEQGIARLSVWLAAQ